MTIRHLYIFRAVCEEGSFTKAANKLYMTQPAVSHVILELEKETGTKLFDRLSRKIYLNQMGQLFLKKVVRLLEVYDELTLDADNLEQKSVFRIGSSITIANFCLPSIMRRFKKQYPETPVSIEVNSAKEIMAGLQGNEIDIALVEGVISTEQFKRIPFSRYKLIAVCAPQYLGKKEEVIAMTELAKEQLLLREKGSAVRDTFDSAMLLHGLTAKPIWTSVNSQALIQAAKNGLGITVLPAILLQKELDEGSLAEVKVEEMSLQNVNHVVFHKDKFLSEPMETFIELTIGQAP